MLSKQVLLTYPDFKKPFDVHTDASDIQLGAVISQDNMPIAFYSRKLNQAQQNYTTMEREILSIVETFKEYHNILLEQTIKVYTDHKNLTYTKFNTQRVIRWRMVIEDFGPEFIYIPGPTNIVADAMSRLSTNNQPESLQINGKHDTKNNLLELADLFAADPLPDDAYPLQYKTIQKEQVRDTSLVDYTKTQPAYSINVFHGGGNSHQLICKNGKIVIPKSL